METVSWRSLRSLAAIALGFLLAGPEAHAQVNSGSNGSDGAFNPTTNIAINMADHPAGIYHYTSVNISNGVTVTFIPNGNNTPVVWMVQSNCVINGTVDVSGTGANGAIFGASGPGGYRGGNGGPTGGDGQGPGGGVAIGIGGYGGRYATGFSPYGNQFLVPLLGGSGGGGATNYLFGGGGGGGAILIAASGQLLLGGAVNARGGKDGSSFGNIAGGGSGGGVRIVAAGIGGNGSVNADGGSGWSSGGLGRVRFDVFDNNFSGVVTGVFTHGFQPIIIQANGQGAQLTVTSVGGVPVSASPSGQLATPDALLSAQQNNPIPFARGVARGVTNSRISPTNGYNEI